MLCYAFFVLVKNTKTIMIILERRISAKDVVIGCLYRITNCSSSKM